MIKVYITDLAAYNEGVLVGEWVELPIGEEELKDKVQETLETGLQASRQEDLCCCSKHEEYFITDYMGELEVGQYANVYRLNRQLLEVEEQGEDDTVFKMLMGFYGDLEDVMNIIRDHNYIVFHDVKDEEDVVRYYFNMTSRTGDIPDWLVGHIDYKSIYREWEIAGNTFIWDYNNRMCVEVFNC